MLSHLESLSELDITNTNNSFPWGININLETKFENLKASWLFTILQNIQSFYYQLYDTQDKISLYMNTNNIESVLAFQKLKFIKSILKGRENEKRKYMRLVQGPALTWVIYEKDNKVRINLAPRILSRGNAMEALGIWVEHKSLSPKESDKREQKAQLYYRQLEKKFKLLV